MKKTTCLLIVSFISVRVLSQNLVPNGDFELYSSCPTSASQIDTALFWTVPTSYTSTDYYNACASLSTGTGVPVNNASGLTYQPAHSGNGYAGIYLSSLFSGSDIREHLEVPLTSPLIAGQTYHFEMYANLINYSKNTTDAIGVFFSDTLLSGINSTILPFVPQINNQAGNVFDTLNWTLVQGNYTAAGGEQFITIGNFLDDANTVLTVVNPSSSFDLAYVYIDDVSLTNVTGTNEVSKNHTTIYPNPFSDIVTVTTDNQPAEIIVCDITSRELIRQCFFGFTSISTSQITRGTYWYSIQNKNGLIKAGKLIKN